MKTLALDLGTTTGWCINDEISFTSGTQSFKPGRYEGGGMRFLRFKQWLTELKNTAGVDIVYYEEVRRHSSTDAAHCYGGLMATLTAWCEHHQIPYQGVPVGTIKKHMTGKGNANKQMVMDAVKAAGHDMIKDDNEADAIALMYTVKEGL